MVKSGFKLSYRGNRFGRGSSSLHFDVRLLKNPNHFQRNWATVALGALPLVELRVSIEDEEEVTDMATLGEVTWKVQIIESTLFLVGLEL